jgi:N-acetylneuraminate synthase
VLLHCVLEYPTPLDHANLLKIKTLCEQFPDCFIGYSDHTKPTDDSDIIKTAYNLGALLVEKHFTLDKTLKGNDHYHAMDPEDAKAIIRAVERMDMIRGRAELVSLETEEAARKNARRSLVSAVDIKQGDLITSDMLTFKRPASGISPADIGNVLGHEAACDIPEDTVLQPEMVEAIELPEAGDLENGE